MLWLISGVLFAGKNVFGAVLKALHAVFTMEKQVY
jgi:hypothetical protein